MKRRQITVSPGFWLLLAGFWFLDEWGLLPPFLLAAGFHEAAHLGALRLLGIPVSTLELRADGAIIRAELQGEAREAWVIAAGPACNLLLALLFRHASPLFSLCNLCLGCCNLLPLSPLDGGRLCVLLLPYWLGEAGMLLCQLLHWGTLALVVICGVWASCGLHYGLLPLLLAGFFLWKLPNPLAKPAEGW